MGFAKSRDADNTRQLLLRSARKHFARDGYTATTVRDIATDAGVNVALINRYFVSKEGLFEACLSHAAESLRGDDAPATTVEQLAQSIVSQLVGEPTGERQLLLLLLLRSSGDQRADQIRRSTLETFAERIAVAAGWSTASVDGDRLLLAAQIVLSTALGIALLSSSTGLEPLTSASDEDLYRPLVEVFRALLPELARVV
jgi:AcrR family transcriptional regulator